MMDADGPPAGFEPEPPCPKCGSILTIPILYGFPSGEMEDAASQGTAALGGCDFVISAGGKHPPQSACKACGARW
jgi:hypothetical protein